MNTDDCKLERVLARREEAIEAVATRGPRRSIATERIDTLEDAQRERLRKDINDVLKTVNGKLAKCDMSETISVNDKFDALAWLDVLDYAARNLMATVNDDSDYGVVPKREEDFR